MHKRPLSVCRRIVVVVVLGVVASGIAHGADRHWTSVGPFVGSGRVLALAIDPSSDETVYAATEAGVFKTVDGGTHWARSSVGLPLSPITALVADPSLPSTLYALAWLGGIFRTSNEGLTWDPVGDGVAPANTLRSLAIDPEGVLYACTDAGVFKSVDRGQTWTHPNQGIDSPYLASIAPARSTPTTLYAATDTGTFRTTNGGGLWTRTSTLQVSALVVDPLTSDLVYGLSSLGVAKSVDGGATWVPKNSGLPVGASASALTFDPASRTTLYLTTSSSIFRSTDGGETWADRSAGVEASDLCPGAIAIGSSAPHTLYLGNQCSGGVFKSMDAAASWTRTGDVFAPPWVSALLPDGESPAVLAATDHGVFRTMNMGASWTTLNSGLDDVDLVSLVQAPSDFATLYAGARSGKLYRTADRGLTWVQTALAPELLAGLLAVDPASSATVYVAENTALVRSSDAGQTWNQVRTFGAGISTLVFSAARLYVATSGGETWATGDGGVTWQLLHAFDSYEGITAIRIDPRSPAVLYASWIAVGSAPPEYTPIGGVFKSTDGGSNWQSVEDSQGVTALVMSPENSSVLYAATVRGQVLGSIDAGASWQPVGEGLPDARIAALTIHPLAPSTLFVGMSGVFALRGDDREVQGVSGSNRSPRAVTRPD
ncbi:MAG: hypothetical protein WAU32_03255 [Thermoanaerobaculia bacterium]